MKTIKLLLQFRLTQVLVNSQVMVVLIGNNVTIPRSYDESISEKPPSFLRSGCFGGGFGAPGVIRGQ
jgi:hypothetical protein